MDNDKKNMENHPGEHFDLTEESSKRPGGEEATTEARKAENDDVVMGNISKPDDDAVENRVSTSLSDD